MSELEHKRILLKFSGESVAGNDEHGIDPKILDDMADSVKSCKEVGAEIGQVGWRRAKIGRVGGCLLHLHP